MERKDQKPAKRQRGSASSASIASAGREREAIVLRRGGASYADIADRFGFADRRGAKKAVERDRCVTDLARRPANHGRDRRAHHTDTRIWRHFR